MNRTHRRFPAAALAAALLWTLAAAPVSAQTKDWEKIPKPPLHKFQIPQPKKIVFGNGLTVFLMEDRELPLIDAFVSIKGGSRNEPAAKAGLATIFGQVWRTGGTKSKTGDQLDDLLEARAAKVETGADVDSASLSLSCLKGDFDIVLGIFDDILKNPEFRAEKIALVKTNMRAGISRRNDNPLGIAEREATKLGFGPDSPYARQPEYVTVEAVTREDLLAWHAKYVHPERAILSVVGDFEAAAMEARLRKAFGTWPKGNTPVDPPAAYRSTPVPGVYFVAKDDVNQTNIRMVAPGIRRDNPDYFAVEVMNEILGGGFASRLFSNIRSKKGLAYAVGGGLRSSYDHPGLLRLTLGTKSETTAAGIDALLEEVQNIVAQPATEGELARAKDAILNSFIFRFDSKEKVLHEQATYAFYGYPPDFLDRYRREIEKVTAADVARVAKKYVHKEDLAILVVGKAADFDRPLSSFGKVTPVDITIPTPEVKKSTVPASAGSRQAGRALFAKAVEAMGGAQKIAAARDLRVKGQSTVKTPQGEMALAVTQTTVFPDKTRVEIRAPFGEITTVLTPQAAFRTGAMGEQDLPANAREEQRKDMGRSPLMLARKADDPKLSVVAAGKEKIGDVETAILDIAYEGIEVRWFVDPATGRLLRSSYAVTGGQQGPGTRTTDYSDYRSVDGLTFAFKQESTFNGEKFQAMSLEEIKVNTNPDPKIFEKPAPKEPPK